MLIFRGVSNCRMQKIFSVFLRVFNLVSHKKIFSVVPIPCHSDKNYYILSWTEKNASLQLTSLQVATNAKSATAMTQPAKINKIGLEDRLYVSSTVHLAI